MIVRFILVLLVEPETLLYKTMETNSMFSNKVRVIQKLQCQHVETSNNTNFNFIPFLLPLLPQSICISTAKTLTHGAV
jgi:hypothetical protein